MELEIKREDLSHVDSGGAYQEVKAVITIDSSLSKFKQRQSLIYELLTLYTDPMEFNAELNTELAHVIAENLEQLED